MTKRDPKTKLKSALDILDQFTDDQSLEPILKSIKPQSKGMGIRRIMGFAHRFISASLSKKSRKDRSVGVEKAIDDVKRYHPIICRSTAPEHKKLSHRALSSIQKYNQLIDPSHEKRNRWYEKLFFFLAKKTESPLASKATIQLSNESEQCAPAMRAADAIQNALLKQEEDAFRMKAISLIKKQGILFPSIEAALKCIRETPIFISSSDEQESTSVVTLNQTLTPFPGETIILSGAFKRSADGLMPTTPISNSFELTTSNNHTGHPFPSQHNGWTLPDPLCPTHLHRPNEIPLLKTLLDKKEEIKNALRNQHPLKRHAHSLINLKKEAAESELDTFIQLHMTLCFALISAAPPYLIQPNTTPIVLKFFEWVKQQPSPYTSLSVQWREFNERYLWHPYRKLKNCWIEESDPGLLSDDSQESYSAAKKILSLAVHDQNTPLPPEVNRFFHCMSSILSIPVRNIYLQYFSELVEYQPPKLNDFEKKLQTLAFTQMQDYMSELDSDLPERPFEKMKRSLTYETELLSQQGQYHSLVSKLEHYYAKRMF